MIRFFDVLFSILGLIILLPLFLILAIWIKIDSRGPVFYKQVRVGKAGIDFNLYKFRSMRIGSDKKGLLTIGENDSRITNSGRLLRKYKLDEFPQLLNVIKGEMSLVGPRPEVRKYVEMYNTHQTKVLNIKPGLTDWASIQYSNENEILEKYEDPEKAYINVVMPEKIRLNLLYAKNRKVCNYFKVIFATILKIVGGEQKQ